jgi:hypothetical protein
VGFLFNLDKIKNVNDFKNHRIFFSSNIDDEKNFIHKKLDLNSTPPVRTILNIN